jgi:hypothetical protein
MKRSFDPSSLLGFSRAKIILHEVAQDHFEMLGGKAAVDLELGDEVII